MKRHTIFALLLLASLLAPTFVAAATSTSRSEMESHPSDPREPGKNAASWLFRNDEGVAVHVRTDGLDEAAYTVWWLVFNYPEFCRSGPCTSDDLPANGGDPAVEASIVYATGGLVGSNGKGRFSSGLAVGDVTDALFGPGVLEPHSAEIQIQMRSHGAIDPETIHLQLSTPSSGCPPQGCLDQQRSIHQP